MHLTCCKHCGWPRHDHDNKEAVSGRDRTIIQTGRTVSLARCIRFEGEQRPGNQFATTGRADWWNEGKDTQ